MSQIGIYPGTFDPAHDGHISFALKAKEVCNLDKVVFLPETSPRNKQNVSPMSSRVGALKFTCKKFSGLDIFTIPSSPFTVEKTLPLIREKFSTDELTLLVGSDVFMTLKDWPDVKKLVESVDIVVGQRKGSNLDQLKIIAQTINANVKFIELPSTAHLSSRGLRDKTRQ